MIIKGRSPNLRHVPRTHRVDLDWLFERVSLDPGVLIKYVGTKEQLGDILTKKLIQCSTMEIVVGSYPDRPVIRKSSF